MECFMLEVIVEIFGIYEVLVILIVDVCNFMDIVIIIVLDFIVLDFSIIDNDCICVGESI